MTEREAIDRSNWVTEVIRGVATEGSYQNEDRKLTMTEGGATISTPNSEKVFEDLEEAIDEFCR